MNWLHGIIVTIISFITCLYIARVIEPELKSFDNKMMVFTIALSLILGLSAMFW
jgi:hypothetical protein